MYCLSDSGSTYSNGRIGYAPNGGSAPDTTAEIRFDNLSTENLTLKNSQVNPNPGVYASGFAKPGSYLLSYNQDYDTGTVRIWGDYTISGSTFTLAYTSETYTGGGDANMPKKLYLGPAASGLNNGRSKITIGTTGGFVLKGVSSGAVTMDMLPSGGTYYTFVDSGALTLAYAIVRNAD